MRKLLKRTKIILLIIILVFFSAFILSRGRVYKPDELEYGLTFSSKQARDLGFEADRLFIKILDELKVKNIRLAAYWDIVAPTQDSYDWTELDWLLARAEDRGIKVILALGGRLPRWPECHFPDWAKDLPAAEREAEILKYIRTLVERYREHPAITAWQVENEPFLPYFGECPPLNRDFLDQEIALVRSLDPRPILMTDSGELSWWVPAAKRADIFGTTMYLDTYSQLLRRYVHYPIQPGFFRFKKNIARLFARPEKWLVIELQAEPWGPRPYQYLSRAERDKTMNLEKFREILEFSRQAGFREFYLWGAEWWAWECEINGDCRIWEEAKELFVN